MRLSSSVFISVKVDFVEFTLSLRHLGKENLFVEMQYVNFRT